ncbi:MAG: response regulator, partial [Deltaproteobacteria bacterium]|nr:response regulator [Deltaproteobacteria bacterium]
QKNTDRLIRLINEVLDVAKIEAGAIQMHFDKFSLVDTIDHAVLGIEAFAHTQGIKLLWEKPQLSPLVVIDRDRIEQVMTNLLSNAIKFTEPGGAVSVACEWENDRVIIEVTDTGAGIHEDFLERIFQKFQQAESAAHKAKEGTGLGLTIAKAIVEEHGGTIWVQSKIATGSTFSFSLPWNGTEFVESKKPVLSPLAKQKRKTILVIDNEPDFTHVLKKMLEHEGYWALTAPDGKTGVELAIKHRPDLVLLDVMMPDMDGFTVRKLLAAAPTTQNIPVVFVTISPDVPTSIDAQVLAKPLVAEDFKAWLKNFFTTAQKAA